MVEIFLLLPRQTRYLPFKCILEIQVKYFLKKLQILSAGHSEFMCLGLFYFFNSDHIHSPTMIK